MSPRRELLPIIFRVSFFTFSSISMSFFKMQTPKLDSFQCLSLCCFMQRENRFPALLKALRIAAASLGPFFPSSVAQLLPTLTTPSFPVCRVLPAPAPEWLAGSITWNQSFALNPFETPSVSSKLILPGLT